MLKQSWYRTAIIVAALLFTVVYDVPTIGWLSLSDPVREKRIEVWKEQDSTFHAPAFFADTWRGIRRWAEFDRSKVVNLGLDLQGGVHIVLGFDLTQEAKDRGFTEPVQVQELILQSIRRRIDSFEAKDPVIQSMGTNQIQIQLPGERDLDRARNLIKQTAQLAFHIVAGKDESAKLIKAIGDSPKFKGKFTPFIKAPSGRIAQFNFPKKEIDRIKPLVEEINNTKGLVPEGKMLALSQPPNPMDPEDQQIYELYLMGKALMTGEGLKMAAARPDDQNPGKYQILFEFGGAAANKFGEVTENNINNAMAIALDGVVCSAPVIRDKISRNGQITGNFSPQQAQDLAIALNSGSLPVPVFEVYTGVVGPGLGADSIRQGLYAAIVGLVAVLIFMTAYYRLGGLIANMALFLNAFILLALFSYFNLTLTLPGIAGFVLTLGMAVDANVLIFERVREEVRNGKSLIASIELGYERASVTIVDANVTTLIAALVMVQWGTGPVQGFGIALALGILTSVFTALVVSKAVFDILIAKKKLKKLTMMSVFPHGSKLPFIEWRNRAFAFSIIVTALGIAWFFGRGYESNFGVDFAGGTSMIVKLDTPDDVGIANVRSALDTAGFKNAIVQAYGSTGSLAKNQFAVRTSEFQGKSTEGQSQSLIEDKVRGALGTLCGADADAVKKVVLDKVEVVGPTIGKQLRKDALLAVTYALIFQILYLWFRYNLVFAITAIVALIHDALFAVGVLSIYGGYIDMTVVAAVLTIIGYSVNDTVVVYDRIRENMRMYAGRGLSYGQIMDLAINQTLSRTVLTSAVTLLTVIALWLFGGQVLRDFSFALMVGICIGTYSSIFVASTLAYVWQNWRKNATLSFGASKLSTSSGPQGRKRGPKSSEATA